MPKDSVTPSRQQYLDIKREHPEAILFFRLGDFYETFDEDAEITARELDIVLTSRPVGKGVRVPLAGIPYHAVDNYLSRLIEKGYHVAICEQMGNTPVNGLVPRKVVRVVTPGTVTEPGLLPGDSNNYLASVILDDEVASVSYVDITTGEFAVTELPREAIRAELTRLHPAELLIPDNQVMKDGIQGHQTSYPSWKFEPGKCEETLLTHFNASTLEGFGIKGHSLPIRSAGAILQYLKETQPNSLTLLTSLRSYSINEFMTLDASTRRNLELDETLRGERKGSLLGTLDHTVTPMGKRMMHQWVSQPLLNVEKIQHRQNGVQHFFDDGMKRAEIRNVLKPLADLERLANRVMAGQAQPRDLVALRDTLEQLPTIIEVAGKDSSLPNLTPANEELMLLQTAIDEDPPATLQNTGIIRAGYSQELDSVVDSSKHARDWIANLEAIEREKTGIKTLKVGYNKVFGYYIEISRGAADKAPKHYIRKQTLVNAERFITPEMKEYETLVLNAEERIREIELRVFKEVCAELSKSAFKLLETARALAQLDVLSALAEVAALGDYCRPEVHEGSELEIHEGRHPVVEQLLNNDRYMPNDIIFEKGEIVRIITGPNMSGKSTYLRQAALITLMAQIGSFVPADSAKIGLVDRIFTRIGAQDEIHAGQSTFMVEMVEAANILHHATSRSLLILDEIGRGTSTYDGLSIAWGIIEFVHN
ncbi:MAG TPA: DNA mismatch repair protein MutS, partial [Anaerolineales bacterium]|nr:DNA mismatch repair protein MutS [Anaerolineales bacterium]